MIHILQGFSLKDRRMATMFADRKRLFVDLMRWSVPVVDEDYEIDQFDGAAAIYLIAIEDGGHIGSMRLLPTDRPHMLDTVFPSLCAGRAPSGNAIAEITRLCLPSRLGAARRREVRDRLISAMVDHALTTGITTFTGVVGTSFLAQIMVMGWRCERLGDPAAHSGMSLGAFRIAIDPDTPRRLAATGIYREGAIVAPLALAA
jgi:acyl homoserine lactone synthase